MKLLFLQLTFFIFGFVVSIETTNHETLDSILKELHIDVDTKLLDLFPDLDEVSKFQTPEGNQLPELNECYNKKVGNKTLDIFKDNIHSIIIYYFETQATLTFRSDVSKFVSNLKELANNIIDCVTNPNLKERSKLGITSLFIYSKDEYLNSLLNNSLKNEYNSNISRRIPLNKNPKCKLNQLSNEKPLLKQFSWQDEGYVTRILDQQDCGSCYIFATVAAMESQYMINIKKENISFSEQAILNCMYTKFSRGCAGGVLIDPVERMIKVGVSLEKYAPYCDMVVECKDYPIFMKANDVCAYNDLTIDQMKRLIYRNGPAAIVINIEPMHFLKGPFNGKCSSSFPNHGLLIVGWNEKYWIIKNSFSTNWGIDGYLYLPIKDCNCGFNREFVQIIVNKIK